MSAILPIYKLMPALKQQLNTAHEAILEAAPGAGKTTVVPLELMNEAWLDGRQIVMLEPRRLAAKTAAKRLADTLNEPLGKRIGYRIRHEGAESQDTQVLVVTEGVLTRMLQDDPSLESVALVIFDEFHERNIHSDLALALCLQARELFRDDSPLKLLIMSATLDTAILEERLSCKTLVSEGRNFPVTIHYGNKRLKTLEVVDEVIKQTLKAYQEEDGSLLVFLPGQKEIRHVASQLSQALKQDPHAMILPLYGELSLKEQEVVIQPIAPPHRKIVLATAIAQTSLTIEGIRVVIDSGLSREAQFDANTATTRLHTRRATQAETTQRMGRAGRREEGVCYRWWSEEQQHQLAPQASSQIECVDLSSLTLDVAKWGVQDRLELDWITPPPLGHWQQSVELLSTLGALDPDHFILTPHGEAMAQLGLAPRLAHLLIKGCQQGQPILACQICALLSEGDPFTSQNSDFSSRLLWFKGEHNQPTRRPKSIYQTSFKQWQQRSQGLSHSIDTNTLSDQALANILASAFTDRLAKRLGEQANSVRYKLSNGRIAVLDKNDTNAQADYLVVLDLGGHQGHSEDRIFLAQPFNLDHLQSQCPNLFSHQDHVAWSKKDNRLIYESQTWLGKLCIHRRQASKPSEDAIRSAMCVHLRREGIAALPWDDNSLPLKARLAFAHRQDAHFLTSQQESWPNMSDEALLASLENWLGPYLGNITNQAQLDKIDLKQILLDSLPWELQKRLQDKIPERLCVASGNHHKVDYSQPTLTLRVKLQEMFGTMQNPTILGMSVKIELLSPAQRPLAVTQDLPFFWKEAYPEVKKEMRGRYPKHPWPDDPMSAIATAKTKRALEK
ncbi:ATP-dependent RNA helicase HrpB [Marinomonas spartinae]|uniref:ATP-dependent helicase HrpB n=1 Tax=Marinomonas spartinae TaxID=1792290 RepID=UPI000808C39B|nr:ATP-dependent helicase HrpB [Marinomonas spartinae]SBS29196.1 ATP-dependent RNA helicase HrpB [Marinomonas spartinae]